VSRLPGFLEEVCSRTSARQQQMHGFQSSSCHGVCGLEIPKGTSGVSPPLHQSFVRLSRHACATHEMSVLNGWMYMYRPRETTD